MDFPWLCQIPRFKEWKDIKELTGGNKKERKFRLIADNGEKCILRITTVDRLHLKHQEFANLIRLQPFALNIPKPLEFGLCQEGTHMYMLLSWIEGETVGSKLADFSEQKQYDIGYQCGQTLAELHSLSKVKSEIDWLIRYKEVERKILKDYYACNLPIDKEQIGLDFLEENKHFLKNRPQIIKHGDYHANNLIITPEQEIGIIDFDRCVISDPYEEFAIIVWTAQDFPSFADGQIAGYFNDEVPPDFYPLLAYYITVYAFEHISWALGYGKNPPEIIKKTAEKLINLFDNYSRLKPKWR